MMIVKCANWPMLRTLAPFIIFSWRRCTSAVTNEGKEARHEEHIYHQSRSHGKNALLHT